MIGIHRPPLQVRELPRGTEVDLGHERAVESVFPSLEGRQDGKVLGLERVHAGLEDVGDLALVHEDGRLAFAHGELGAVLDLVVVALEPVHDRVIGVVDPLHDVDKFATHFVPDVHSHHPSKGQVSPVPRARSRRADRSAALQGQFSIIGYTAGNGLFTDESLFLLGALDIIDYANTESLCPAPRRGANRSCPPGSGSGSVSLLISTGS